MNYISFLVGFRNYRRKAPIGKNAILLYFILWEYVNEYRLPTVGFTVANSVLQANSGLSRRDLDSARNELKLNGYIDYKKGAGNQCGTYRLIVRFDTQIDTQIDTQNDTQIDTQNDTQIHHINNTKLNKTKQKRGRVECAQTPPLLEKNKYGEFQKVELTDNEYSELAERIGNEPRNDYIARLDNYIARKGAEYENHYAVILDWHYKDSNGCAKDKAFSSNAQFQPRRKTKFSNFKEREDIDFEEIQRLERERIARELELD